MLAAACVATLLMAWLWRAKRKRLPPLGANDLRRLRELSDKVHRDDIHPFVEP